MLVIQKEGLTMDCKSKLSIYKRNVMNVLEDGDFNHYGKILKKSYILPVHVAHKNIMIDVQAYKFIRNNTIQLDKCFEGKPITIKLHRYWYHLNSSQLLTINYFYDFIENIKLLNSLLCFLGINERAKEATLEYSLVDQSEIDFVIKLENDKFVYFEVKYSELEFGSASSTKTDYKKRQVERYSKVSMGFEDFKKHYQFARNIILGENGSYSVFLVPKFNDKIIFDYNRCSKSVLNADLFNYRMVFWEDLLVTFPNERIHEKYFADIHCI